MNPDAIRRINNYIRICENLRNSRFVKETKKIEFKLELKEIGESTMTVGNFDEDLLRSCLMDFRKIYLTSEDTNFYRVCNEIYKIGDQKTRERVAKCRKLYKASLNKPSIGISIGKKGQKPDKIIDDWLHGYYFHEEQEKRNVIAGLHAARFIHKAIFITTIIELLRLSLILANNAKLIVDKINGKNASNR